MANIALITNNILTDSGTPLTSIPSGSGTTNYLSKWTSSSVIGNSLVYDDGTNVGIGTTSPGQKLDVNGNIRLSSNSPSIISYTSYASNIFTVKAQQTSGQDIGGMIIDTGNGESRFGSFRLGGGYFTTFYVNNAELIRLSTSNNVLIGTTTDAGFKLDVNGTLRAQGKLTITTGGTEITGTAVLYSGAQSYGQVQIFSASAFQMFNGANNSKASFQYINANGLLLTTNSDNISGVLKGLQVNPTMVASANNDVLVGLDITPTFTNGAFTGVSNYALRSAGNIAFTAGANRYLTMQNPSSSGSANHIIIQGASANTSGTGGNIYLYEGSGAGGPGRGSIYIGATNGWTTAYVTGRLTVSNSGPNTDTAFQVNAGGQNGLTINWDNVTPYMGYGLVVNRQSRFYNSSSYTFDNNLIIGSNTNAGYKLDVNGTARVQGQLEVLSTSSAQGLLLKHTALSTTATQIYYNSSDAVTYLDTLFSYTASQPFGSVNIRTKDSLNALTSRLYVEGNSGNVGIGTTTFLGKFQVGSGSATQFQVASSGASIYVGPSSGNYNMNITTNTIQSSNSGTTNTYLYIQPNGSGNVAMCSSGTNKVLIGTTTDAGYKLDVNGTARINSTLALTSSTYAGTFSFYLSAANTLIGNSSNIGNWLQVGGGNRVYITGQEFNSTSRGNIFGNTVGGEAISATTIIAQSSGTTATTGLSLRYTINNTGTYVGISRGIYYNPTITSLTGTTHRAIETVTGDVIFGSTSGVVGIGTTSLSTEANLYLGAKSTIEGGQLVLQKGTSQTYATHLDNYNNQFRVMVGTDTGSTAAQLIVMHSTGNVLINTGTDNGYKLQVAGNTYVSGVTLTSSLNVQNAAEVNSNEGSNDLLVYADLTSGVDVLYGGGKVKANIYTTPVTTPKTINPSSTVAFMKWYPTTSQGVFIDYVLYIDSGTEMRSGTVTIVNDTSGNAQLLDTKTADLNGSTANITFAVVNNGGTMEFQVTNSGAAPAYMNILTRYIPTIF